MRYRPWVLALFAMSLLSAHATDHDWRVVYDGQGRVRAEGRTLVLIPKAPKRASETHSALVLAKKTEAKPVKNFTISFRYQIRAQLRKPASAAQPWETLWLFFNYRPDGKFKKTNYLLVKENGIEIGKAWGDVHQKFLYTALEPRLTDLASWHRLTVTREHSLIRVQLDDQPVKEIRIDPKALYSAPGALGLYSEDAHVRVTDIRYHSIPLSTAP